MVRGLFPAPHRAQHPAAVARGRILLDGRNCMPGERWMAAGWTYRALGRGVPEAPAPVPATPVAAVAELVRA